MTPAQELLIYFRQAVGQGQLFEKKYGLLLERPIEKNENIIDVTFDVQLAAAWIGYRLAGWSSRLRNGQPAADYRLGFAGNEGRAWVAITRPDMEVMQALAQEAAELENSLEDDGPDSRTEEQLRIAREKLGELMTDFILIWRM